MSIATKRIALFAAMTAAFSGMASESNMYVKPLSVKPNYFRNTNASNSSYRFSGVAKQKRISRKLKNRK